MPHESGAPKGTSRLELDSNVNHALRRGVVLMAIAERAGAWPLEDGPDAKTCCGPGM
ncbi:hypothetical protein DOTSEDRAFT_69404 [Dothistroma septosporum NZE10]|uniref:Uncharacterized protein n=1 Tax=Dothistroma septosporum (strain NZE10 / CBS 128990) TaxID=675120 RepID=N1PVF6_DOTSN|nr:hypothetical protein DOTSEDRAFT_69404 [Dothistroma septosporum NZE10]